jgi:predicted polyphosphate/ATP-dependent NAD kinase
LATVGIIANPAAGKDIRRLVAHGRFVPNEEKVNILRRIFAGLDAAGVEQVVMMPDASMLGRVAMDGADLDVQVEFLDMTIHNDEDDSSRASQRMADMGVGCLITLGGDGTNRAVAKGSRDVPLVPVSTGTNNVFPTMVEGTIAGLAAGVVARNLVDLEKATTAHNRLEVHVDGSLRDIALVDVAISRERFVGSRAIWDIGTVYEVFLTRPEPASIGLSAIGAHLRPPDMKDGNGIYARLGPGETTVMAAVAPGKVTTVGIERWHSLSIGEPVEIELRPCTVALDGERSFPLLPHQTAQVSLSGDGPRVVSIEAALREASLNGVFKITDSADGIRERNI